MSQPSSTANCIAAIDFGTSNSAVCVVNDGSLFPIPLEHGHTTIPTAVFHNAEQGVTTFGRQALSQYQDGNEGRLMRSLKSLLGSDLLAETTVVNGRAVPYRHIIGQFLTHLRELAESHASCPIERVVLGRPVHFVDDDEERDELAETTLGSIAQEIGFREVRFQYEPIVAALDLESSLANDELALVCDIGGGTSDFSIVRVGPSRAAKPDRSGDVLASGGIHVAGTDFDQRLSMSGVMPLLGYGAPGKEGRPVPTSVYFDLATWHKINFLYSFPELARAEELKLFLLDMNMHERLMAVLRGRHGHRIASHVETAKIAVAENGSARIDLSFIEPGLDVAVSESTLSNALSPLLDRITGAALQAVARAGIAFDEITILYFTGGSTGLRQLRERLQGAFPRSRVVAGDKFSSVVRGLGLSAARQFDLA
jgi:hypothetical chaperone protein